MQQTRAPLTDEKMEWVISLLLRIGVISSAALVLAGGILYLHQHGNVFPHYQTFQGEPSYLRTLGGILGSAMSLDSRGIIQLGLVLLVLTPVARVVFSVAAFAMQRDRLYVCVTLFVLIVLLYDLLWSY
jgi:uncharacterized membrane protein